MPTPSSSIARFLASLALLATLTSIAWATRSAPSAAPLSLAFTYQGELRSAGLPQTGPCDLQIGLWDAALDGNPVGTTQTFTAVPITLGLFTVSLNSAGEFGPDAFNGNARWLALAARCPTGTGTFEPVPPRQPLNAAPYADYALNAGGFTGYAQVLTVAPRAAAFTSIQAALDSVVGTPTTRYLVWVAPGVYSETVRMEPYVDIHGAGRNVTLITSVATSGPSSDATVRGAAHASLRDVSVIRAGGLGYNTALYNGLNESPDVENVTVIAQGGISQGIFNEDSSAHYENVDVRIICARRSWSVGIYNSGGAPTFSNVSVYATGGFDSTNTGMRNTNGATTRLTQVDITGFGGDSGYGLYNDTQAYVTVRNSVLNGSGGDILNVAIYNQDSTLLLTDADVLSTNGIINVGLSNELNGQVNLANVRLTASESTGRNIALQNIQSTTTLFHVVARATQSNICIGMFSQSANVTARNSTFRTDTCNIETGLSHENNDSGTYTLDFNHSLIVGRTNVLVNISGMHVRLGATQVEGGPLTGGDVECIGVYDGTYTSAGYSVCP